MINLTQMIKFMGQHGVHLGPVGPRRASCWPHEPCYQGCGDFSILMPVSPKASACWHCWLTAFIHVPYCSGVLSGKTNKILLTCFGSIRQVSSFIPKTVHSPHQGSFLYAISVHMKTVSANERTRYLSNVSYRWLLLYLHDRRQQTENSPWCHSVLLRTQRVYVGTVKQSSTIAPCRMPAALQDPPAEKRPGSWHPC